MPDHVMPGASEAEILNCLSTALQAVGVDVSEWPDGLGPSVSLDGDLGVDSFQLMQVARHLEKAYDFRFSLADWVLQEEESDQPSYTVGALTAFVRRHISEFGPDD